MDFEEPMGNIRDAVANNRRLLGQPPQPLHETHDWNELATEAVRLAVAAIHRTLSRPGEKIGGRLRVAADKLTQAAELMGHAADKRAPKPEPTGEEGA